MNARHSHSSSLRRRGCHPVDPTRFRSSSRRWRDPSWTWALLPLIPLVAVSTSVAGRVWISTGDWAIAELVTGDVFSSHPPLLGAYSRFGWNHPGPVLWWMLAPLYEASGRQGWSLLVGVGLWNAFFVSVAMGFARGVSRTFVAVVAVAALVMVLVVDVNRLIEPWNPLTAVTPFFALLVLGTPCLAGNRRAAAVAVGLASVMVQMHVGYALVALPVATVAVWTLIRPHRRRSLLIAATVSLTVLWSPVLVDLMWGEGNLLLIVESLSAGDDAVGMGVGMQIAADALALGLVTVPTALAAGLFVVLTAVGMVAGHHHRVTLPTRSLVLASVQMVSGVLASSRIVGEVHDWLTFWWIPVALLWWASLAWLAIAVVSAHFGQEAQEVGGRAAVGALITVLLAGVCLTAILARPLGRVPDPAGLAATVEAVTPASVAYASEPGGVVELRDFGPDSGWVADGIGAQLARRDLRFTVPDEGINREKWRSHRLTAEGASPERRLWIITGPAVDHLPRLLALLPDAGTHEILFSSAGGRTGDATLIEAEDQLFRQWERTGQSGRVVEYLMGGGAGALADAPALRDQLNRRGAGDGREGLVLIGSCTGAGRCSGG
jgi:hypothetical protein